MPDFLPRREGDRVLFAQRMSAELVASPADYGVPLAEAEAFGEVVAQAAAAWRVSQTPRTRTVATVREKDERLAEMVRQTREMVRRVRGQLGVMASGSDQAARLSRLGLRVASKSRRRLRVPGRLPRVRLSPTVRGRVEVEVIDPAHLQRRSTPRGVYSLAVFCRWRSGAGGPWTRWVFECVSTRMQFELGYPEGSGVGDRLQVTVRWMSQTGEMGPEASPGEVELPPRYAMRMDEASVTKAA